MVMPDEKATLPDQTTPHGKLTSHDLRAIAFPRLDEPLVERTLVRYHAAALKRYADGTTLFHAGDRDARFFVIKSGAIEMIDPSGDVPKTVTIHRAGEFTGDVSQLTGSAVPLSAVAHGDTEVFEVSADTLRELLVQSPGLGDIILQAFIARRQLLRESDDFTGVRVIGSRYSRDTFRVRDFLAKNRILFTWLDLERDPEVTSLLARFGVSEADTPVVGWGDRFLRNPSNRDLAEALGIRRPLEHTVHDLIVVGAGPAGLAALVYGASDGLSTVAVEPTAPGGQAGGSMRIENYLGFPTGISGSELADRAVLQAHKFGARISVTTAAAGLTFDKGYALLHIDGGEPIVAKTVLIATGASYRKLAVEGCDRFEGAGVYYAATFNEAEICRGQDVVVVGSGNSAGQAAIFLATQARKVYLVMRGDDLSKRMSSYLARRIEFTENIAVLQNSEVQEMNGHAHLDSVVIVNRQTGETRRLQTPAVFSFIGATPRTSWLDGDIQTDAHGFILTGPALPHLSTSGGRRDPFLLETSHPGVFAAGDVRAGSVKRVSAAVGEGAMAVQFVYEHLKAR
jgi:thioredoxin reductase (NADPH)